MPDFVDGGKALSVGRLRCGRVKMHSLSGLPLQVGDALEEDSFQIHHGGIVDSGPESVPDLRRRLKRPEVFDALLSGPLRISAAFGQV